jgi:osmotically-inducible protein OsmY
MTKNKQIAATLAVVLAVGVTSVSMWLNHSSKSTAQWRVKADVLSPEITEEAVTKALLTNNVEVTGLTVRSVGGIVILRGNGDTVAAEQAVAVVKGLGATRVANLITTKVIDDQAIVRDAERHLANTNSLAGCLLRVSCEKGVLSVSGTVQHELQKDAARSALRAVRGTREVRLDLTL